MTSYCVHILGCRVNQYEGEQIASVLRSRGLRAAPAEEADLHVIHTCSVTTQAAATSRRTVRRATRLPVLNDQPTADTSASTQKLCQQLATGEGCLSAGRRVVVTGCWATSNPAEARQIPGVDAVISHHEDVAATLNSLLDTWLGNEHTLAPAACSDEVPNDKPTEQNGNDGWMTRHGRPGLSATLFSKSQGETAVKKIPADAGPGMRALPILDQRFSGHQRAFLKIQDGCDAHCTYCIIPKLRPNLWSKPIADAVREAQQLVDAGHQEIVLTGIFLGAYGQPTALRRRQERPAAHHLADLAEALCTQVKGLRRLRFSSLEPGDLTADVIRRLSQLPQVVPHFHLPLQSGSVRLLRRMNRQYTRDDYLWLIDQMKQAFDRPALTTDIICGFPGETDHEFAETLEVVDRAGFIHIHAFSFSARPGTAAARWQSEFVPPATANARIHELRRRAELSSLAYRRGFIGETVEVLVEGEASSGSLRHGRCARYFPIYFQPRGTVQTGDAVQVRIDRVTAEQTLGTMIQQVSG